MQKIIELARQSNKSDDVIQTELLQHLQSEIISFQEATVILGVSRTSLYNYIKRNELMPLINRERVQLFLKSDVVNFKDVVEQNKKKLKHQ